MRLRFPYIRSQRWAWLFSLSGSLVLHGMFLGASLFTILLVIVPERVPVISTVASPVTYEAEWTLRSQFEAIDVSSADSTPEQDRSQEVNGGSKELATLIQERLQVEREQAAEASPEEIKQKLELLGSRLQAVSSEKAISEMTTLLQGTFGVQARAERIPQPLALERKFDFATAQIDDVRVETVDEKPRYMAIMVDANGSTLETELDEADGSQLYETFELMRKFPLMRSVYRGVVMGLMDKMMQKPVPVPAAETPEIVPDRSVP